LAVFDETGWVCLSVHIILGDVKNKKDCYSKIDEFGGRNGQGMGCCRNYYSQHAGEEMEALS